MNCKQAKTQIALLVGNDLEPRVAAELQRHLEACSLCRDRVKDLSCCMEAFQAEQASRWNREPDSLWPKLSVRLAASPPHKPHRMNGWAPAVAVAAACTAMIWMSSSNSRVPISNSVDETAIIRPVSNPWSADESALPPRYSSQFDRSGDDSLGKIKRPGRGPRNVPVVPMPERPADF